jgi:hypothetical protein
MLSSFSSYFERKPPPKGGPLHREPTSSVPASARRNGQERPQAFTKVFRWWLPDGQTAVPRSVEVAGSFTHWQKVPLRRDSEVDGWHVTIHHIPGNRTHHYMLLVDGHPVPDKHADGLAIPHGPQEEQFQLMTARGGRVFMLYAQTK